MRLGIFGYGNMGKAVEQRALNKGHEVIVLQVETSTAPEIDCMIDFSHADIAPSQVRKYLGWKIPVVSGTTGWNDQLDTIREYCKSVSGAFCWAPNFSVGMHIMFHLNRTLAAIMDQHPQYIPHILEIHHTGKQDKPSGTAIALAQQVIDRSGHLQEWALDHPGNERILSVQAERKPDVKGTHRVTYRGAHDILSIRHHALSRNAFADGAILTAQWLKGRSGCYDFEDVLGLP